MPWLFAKVLFAPRGLYPVQDHALHKLSRARSILGSVLVFAAIVRYDPNGPMVALEHAATSASNTAFIAIGIVAVACLVTPMVVPGSRRLDAVRASLRPLVTIALLAVTLAALLWGGIVRIAGTGADGPIGSTELTVVGFLIGVWEWFWFLPFLVFSLYYLAAHLFAVADAHPRLAPIVTIVLVTVLWTIGVLQDAGVDVRFMPDVDRPQLPSLVHAVLTLGGTITAIVFAVLEYRHLGRRGFTLRDGPWY